VIRSSPELRGYVVSLAERADRLRQVDAREDNMLKICSDGRKAALDLELVGVTSATPGKVATVTGNVARLYHDTRELVLPGDDPGQPGGGFQIVFCDLGTPNPVAGTQVYGKIRAGLIEAGVPAGQIRFIHDATTDLQKAALFADCRAGKVAVLLGSTDKLGVGTNIQTRCVALHHVDAPWRPADVEQREGRALRPGNLNPSVDIFRYVSEKSFDSYLWQTLERKARFIGQVLGGRPSGRDVDDIGDATLSYAEVKALATGNPLLMELAEANAQVTRLRHLAVAHTRATRRLELSVTAWQQQITAKERLAGTCDHIAAVHQANPDPAWRDRTGNPIPDGDVPATLARLAREAMASTGYGAVSWRGLHISFSADRQWRQVFPVATIRAGTASLPVELSAAWTTKGQHWRIGKELRSHAGTAAADAARLRDEIEDLRQRAADATRRIGEPFPQAAELETARVRRDAIEQAIRAAAAPEERGDAEPGNADGPADAVVTGMHDGPEVALIPAMVAPSMDGGVREWAVDSELAADDVAGSRSRDIWTSDPVQSGPEVTEPPGELAVPDRLLQVAAAPAAKLPAPDPDFTWTAPAANSVRPASAAALDSVTEPLFASPADGPDELPISHPPWARRPRRSRNPRRRAVQIAAADSVAQLTLFDVPPPPARPTGRRAASAQARPPAPRK
jgi:hypothetical protein